MTGISSFITAALGMAGSFVGGFLWHNLGYGHRGSPTGWIVSILGAMLVLAVYRVASGRRLAA